MAARKNTQTPPEIAQTAPYPVAVEAGKIYWWCACGRSRTQPFCDGSHKGTRFLPFEVMAARTETLWFCGCKQSCHAPMCDGSHKYLLPGGGAH